jgi:hypothetical protein
LRKAGILLTDTQKAQIEAFMEANNLLGAQDVLLSAIEGQVGGTAGAVASATDKMNARFESVVEELSLALLPSVDKVSEAMIDWLDSVEGKKAIQDLTDDLIELGDWIASPDGKQSIEELGTAFIELGNFARDTAGFLRDVKNFLDDISEFNASIFENGLFGTGLWGPMPSSEPSNYVPPAPADRGGARGVTVNVSGITPTAAIGRTVQDALNNSRRLGQR